MTFVSGFVVFQIIWWVVLFAVLPLDAQPDNAPQKGTATSAPKHPRMKKKVIITTAIASVIWIITYFVIEYELFILL